MLGNQLMSNKTFGKLNKISEVRTVEHHSLDISEKDLLGLLRLHYDIPSDADILGVEWPITVEWTVIL